MSDATSTRLLLDDEHELRRAQQVYLSQPMGAGVVRDFTWAQAMNEARRVASHLRSLGLAPGDKVAMPGFRP